MQLVVLAWWLLLSGAADLLAAIAGYIVVFWLLRRHYPQLACFGTAILAAIGLPLGIGALWGLEWVILTGYADLVPAIAGYLVAYRVIRGRRPEIFVFGASVCAFIGPPIGVCLLWGLERLCVTIIG